MNELRVTDVRFTGATAAERATGLLGFTAFSFNEQIVIDGVAVRRTLSNELRLSFPAKTDRSGRKHAYIRPLDDGVRRSIEDQVLAALALDARPAMPSGRQQGDSR